MFQVVAVIFHKVVWQRVSDVFGHFITLCWTFTAKSIGERILNIGQQLAELEAKLYWDLLLGGRGVVGVYGIVWEVVYAHCDGTFGRCQPKTEPGLQVTGHRVTGSALLAGCGRITGQCVRPGV